jgi:predicted nicotinamide N-methyase
MTPPSPADFIRANAIVAAPSLLPELRLYLATEITPIWQASEDLLAAGNVPPPYWAFAWAGGQALARHILDNPGVVAGKRVLDFGAGSGMVAIAAACAAAAQVTAVEIDHFAVEAIALNAALNGVDVAVELADVIGSAGTGWDVVLVGDMCYEQPLARRMMSWLRELVGRGVTVLLGDPGRNYVPSDGLTELARYTVPTSLELEDHETRVGVVWRVAAEAPAA